MLAAQSQARTVVSTTNTIDYPGATLTVAAGISARGDIVGNYRLAAEAPRIRHGFLLSDGRFITVDVPGAMFTNALGIDHIGRIVGRFCTTIVVPCAPGMGPVHGFVRSGGQFFTIDFPDAIRTNAWKITPEGRIVGGYTRSDGHTRIFLLSEVGFTTADVPPSLEIALEIGGMNPRGDVVVTYCDSVGCPSSSIVHGLLMKKREFTVLDFPGAVSTSPFSISPNGNIVGFYDDASGRRHGFLLRP